MAGLDEIGILLCYSAIEQAEEMQIKRFKRKPQNPFELSDKKFMKLFRLNKSMVDDLMNILGPHIPDCSRTSSLCLDEKVLASLRFFATGSLQQDLEESFNISMSQLSISRSIYEVINAVHDSGFFEENVKFHSNLDELIAARQKFYDNYKFPGVVGCIDCTHVAIVPPPKDREEYPEDIFVNRRGYHSINVQLICDADLKILNVNAKYPGSTYDSFIFNKSKVFPAMQNLYNRYPGSYYLLGDSGYPLRPWIMTPITKAASGTPRSKYNKCQMLTWSVIERVNLVLKLRFRCLLKQHALPYQPPIPSRIINTCCALHNMCLENKLENVPAEENDDLLDGMIAFDNSAIDELIKSQVTPFLKAGRRIQQNIVREYFTK